MFSGSKYFKILPALLLSLIPCQSARAGDKDSTRIIIFPTDAFVGNTSFNHRNDSLFEAGDYATIIDNYYKADQTTVYELIGAFYALGSPIESYKQLLTEIYYYNDSLYGNAGAAFIHVNNDADAWLYYLSFPKNKRLVDSLLLEVYDQEKVTAPQYGRKLFHYLISDQYSRILWMHTYSMPGNKKIIRDRQQDSAQYLHSLQNNADLVFKLYQSSGHIFSKQELGSIFDFQFLLLSHEKDSARRAYYLKLIQAAVGKKVCSPSRIISFILRTEYQKHQQDLPHFFDTLEKRIENLKQQYHQPDYVLGID